MCTWKDGPYGGLLHGARITRLRDAFSGHERNGNDTPVKLYWSLLAANDDDTPIQDVFEIRPLYMFTLVCVSSWCFPSTYLGGLLCMQPGHVCTVEQVVVVTRDHTI